jgi:hypothetical protein
MIETALNLYTSGKGKAVTKPVSNVTRKITGDVAYLKESEDYQRGHFERHQFKTVSGDPYKIFVPENLTHYLPLTRPTPLSSIEDNMAHEMEYESEDHDF